MDTKSLLGKSCVPCMGGVPPLRGQALDDLIKVLGNSWSLVKEKHIEKEYKFNDFKEALAFTNKVGELAESEGHHPDIHLAWGYAKVVLWTHKIDGLTESDFILAAKIDNI